ncbi:MAG: zinc ribbon domain-containing protein [Oscillospiraceae bacterium]|nr:zinc ribbon domain-containing protein [Oscillospiraceae bacterium]
MANFCPKCGQPVNPDDAFCESCGTKLSKDASAQAPSAAPQRTYPVQQNYVQPTYQAPVYAGNGAVREGIPQPGFSDRVNNREILAAVRKTRNISKASMLFIVPLPLIGFFLYATITGKMEISEAIRNGAFVSLVFLVFALYSLFTSRAEKSYEAVVTNKYMKERADKSRDDTGRRNRTVDYDYITIAQTTNGKTKKIVETDHSMIWAYDHLNVGDRFRYHPQFAFPYELYDKTKADALHCVGCGAKNPITADRCKRCNLPLLK